MKVETTYTHFAVKARKIENKYRDFYSASDILSNVPKRECDNLNTTRFCTYLKSLYVTPYVSHNICGVLFCHLGV